MHRKEVIIVLFCIVFLLACETEPKTPAIGTPFLGGTEGVAVSFVEEAPPKEVFAGGDFPFDVVVRLENRGEFLVTKEEVRVEITGINPQEFGKPGLVESPEEDILPTRKDPQGNVIRGTPTFVEFAGLNHAEGIAGSSLIFPIRADVCHKYGTIAVSQLCVRKNILNPQTGGICEINEMKTAHNSGAPIQVENLREFPRSSGSVGFSFDIVHKGTGRTYELGSVCEKTRRSAENRVFVDVRPGPGASAGIRCTGLSDGGSQGYANLYGEERKTVTCTAEVAPGDYYLPIEIELLYDYEQTVQKEIIVKASGE